MNIKKIIVLDMFWDEEENNGRLEEVVKSFNDPSKYWWVFDDGRSYQATLDALFWYYNKNMPNLDRYVEYIPEKYLDVVQQLVQENKSSTIFVTTCKYCGEIVATTLDTYERRGGLICSSCSKRLKAIERGGSLAEARPDVIPYYSKRNKLPIQLVPMHRKHEKDNKIHLICPRCKKEHTKRLDAVERSGAYCNQCARIKILCEKGQSLRSEYPVIADMFDKGNNSITSSQITSGSSTEEYIFYCDGKGKLKPHTFKKTVSAMVQAYNKGNSGCPVCTGFEAVRGVNDFKTLQPDKAELWDYENNDCNPEDIYYLSEKRCNFICPKGHKFTRDPRDMYYKSRGAKTRGCPICHGKQLVTGVNDLATLKPDVMEYWDYTKSEVDPTKVTIYSNQWAWFRCKNCGKSYLARIDQRCMTKGYCEDCRDRGWSDEEKELASIIKSWGIEIRENAKIFKGFNRSVDIYIPSKNIAIEYNGLYWHCDEVLKDNNSHYYKYLDCQEMGIQLIYVWEDDFLTKRDVVLKMLKRKLGVSNEPKINARDCTVDYVEYYDIADFVDDNHIQGSCTGSIYQVLRYKGNIVAVAIYQTQPNGYLNLRRYCTSGMIRGGFSKLVSHLELNYPNYLGIETFSDNCISDGSLYRENGFNLVNFLHPDYMYVVNNIRVHKFNYRLKRFETDPNLIYKKGLSERELAILNKLHRVYDAGKLKWKKDFRR